jgi:hypothetical protein
MTAWKIICSPKNTGLERSVFGSGAHTSSCMMLGSSLHVKATSKNACANARHTKQSEKSTLAFKGTAANRSGNPCSGSGYAGQGRPAAGLSVGGIAVACIRGFLVILSPDLIRLGGGPLLPHVASPDQSHAIPCLAARLACSAVAGFLSRVLMPDLGPELWSTSLNGQVDVRVTIVNRNFRKLRAWK